MNKRYKKSVFIFRRDLRLGDNTALIEALDSSIEVMPCFIIDPFILRRRSKNKYLLEFFTETLEELIGYLQLKGTSLSLFKGKPSNVVQEIIKKDEIDAIFVNRDYTPYSIDRDKSIKEICSKNQIPFYQLNDYLLNEPEEVLTVKGTPYTVFTPYFRKASVNSVRYPRKNETDNYSTDILGKIDYLEEISIDNKSMIAIKPGRKECLEILKNIPKYVNYELERNFPSIKGTTHLSPHLKFGSCSIREAYHNIRTSLGKDHSLIKQLYWRDFFTQIGYYFPRIYRRAFREKYNQIKWQKKDKSFEAWCKGKTGFPIVDAGMRELNLTGYMHNRIRMIVASFLTKDLHIDWRRGEKYFANKLVDFDLSVNNGNWQWAASTGCDAQPYFRIFNPWLQQKKYDPKCIYIKKWIPELENVEINLIHNWFKQKKDETIDYPLPIVDHKFESVLSKKLYSANI
ncbi:MAG: cryptochrome/photolyase family protein [Candidatus Thorarchaeota archaeon]